MTTQVEVADILDKAADIIEQRGLCQDGHYYDGSVGSQLDWFLNELEYTVGKTGVYDILPTDIRERVDTCKVCAIGAIATAVDGHPLRAARFYDPLFERMNDAVVALERSLYGDKGERNLTGWNDAAESPQIVVGQLRLAANRARNGS